MTRPIKLGLIAVSIAVATHFAVVLLLPSAIMSFVMRQMEPVTGTNRLHHAPLPNASQRNIVRPSPDLAYSVCVFDLSEGPLRITTPDSSTYLSVSGFADQTDNFFAINDQDIGDKGLELLLVAADSEHPPKDGVRVVKSPTTRGVVLFRRVVENKAHFAAVDQARRLARCEPVTGKVDRR